MFDLYTRVNLDEVVPAHLVDQELSGTRISVPDALRELDSIGEDRSPNLLGKVRGWRNLDNLLVATLDGTVTLEKMDGVSSGISKELDFNMTGTFKETFDKDGSISECRLGFTDGTFERVLEVGLLPDDTHTTSSASHRSLDDN